MALTHAKMETALFIFLCLHPKGCWKHVFGLSVHLNSPDLVKPSKNIDHIWPRGTKGTNLPKVNGHLNLISLGGGGGALEIFRDKSAARVGLAARFHDFFLIVSRIFWDQTYKRPGSYVTFSTCMSARKSLKFVILCTNPMQIGILEVIHITDYFYF